MDTVTIASRQDGVNQVSLEVCIKKSLDLHTIGPHGGVTVMVIVALIGL
jgi:hypothetical protein